MTPYEMAGGAPGVSAVLERLYDRAFVDPIIGFLFVGKDKGRIVQSQVSFTAGFLGGPRLYQGPSLPEAHANLPLLPGHFARRHRLLEEALGESKIPESVQRLWLEIDERLKDSVLAAGEAARAQSRSASR
jgi:methyl-accepting chemotaxis protein